MKKFYTAITLTALVFSASNAQQSPCNNMDFGMQNFTNWTGQTGSNNGSSNLGWTGGLITAGPNAPLVFDQCKANNNYHQPAR